MYKGELVRLVIVHNCWLFKGKLPVPKACNTLDTFDNKADIK